MAEASLSFSIVVPTHNRPGRLAECLSALELLEYPQPLFEVVVVDDGSATARAVAAGTRLERLRVIEQRRRGPAAARNRGAEVGAGDYVAFLDDDCAPVSGWLTVLAEVLVADPSAAVGGPTLNGLPDEAFASASQLLVDYLIARDAVSHRDVLAFLPSSNLALARTLFLDSGGFDPLFDQAAGEDRDFCARWQGQGRPLRLAEGAIVYHRHELRLPSFVRQHYVYGRGAYRFRRRRPNGRSRVIPEPLAFYRDLVTFPARQECSRGRRLGLSALLALSQAATAAGYAREALVAGPVAADSSHLALTPDPRFRGGL